MNLIDDTFLWFSDKKLIKKTSKVNKAKNNIDVDVLPIIFSVSPTERLCHRAGVPKLFRVAAPFSIKNFPWRPILKKYIPISKQISYLVSLNILKLESMKISRLFFYENQKFRPQRDPFIHFEKKFFALYQNKWRIWSL